MRLTAAFFIVVASLVASLPAEAGGRIALVIGNAAYRHAPPLPNPGNDARDVGQALRELGFEVIEAFDLDKRALDEALQAFARRIAVADTVLVFYAGHGLQVGGVNYLLPVDAKLESERDLAFQAVRLDVVSQVLAFDRDGLTSLVFLDACRDNPLARSLARSMGTRSTAVEPGLAQVRSPAGTFIAFSTQPGNVARDGTGRNSPFTAALLKRMRAPGKGLGAVMMDVRKDVIAATRNTQVPWDHSALTAEFHFLPRTGHETGSVPDRTPHEDRTRRLQEELGYPPAR